MMEVVMLLKIWSNNKSAIPFISKQDKTNRSSAPMPAGPIVYRPDGQIDWANMWDSFCELALDGGPPHRESMLCPPPDPDPTSAAYAFAAGEIARGVYEVCGLTAVPAQPGWLQIRCHSCSQARWLAEAIVEENVQAQYDHQFLLLPVGDAFTLTKEIKNVITAVAKTTHYWTEHLSAAVKHTLALQDVINRIISRISDLRKWAAD
jgi:hypothetical protein